jgi:hypothetical protein
MEPLSCGIVVMYLISLVISQELDVSLLPPRRKLITSIDLFAPCVFISLTLLDPWHESQLGAHRIISSPFARTTDSSPALTHHLPMLG